MASAASITSNGGNITLGGGANVAVGYAVGSGSVTDGITLYQATISAGAGNVTLNGKGKSTGGTGVYIHGNGSATSTANNSGITTTTGHITVNGFGVSGSNGIYFHLPNTYIVSTSGNIVLNATGGIQLYYTAEATGTSPRIITAGSGNITLESTATISLNSSYIQAENGNVSISAVNVSQVWGGYFKTTGTGNISVTSSTGNVSLGGNNIGVVS